MSGEAFTQQPVLVLAPVGTEGLLIAGKVPGSRHVVASCGHRCWIAPSGQNFVTSTRPRTLCAACFLIEKPTVNGYGAAPGMREELIALGCPAVVVDGLLWELELTQKD